MCRPARRRDENERIEWNGMGGRMTDVKVEERGREVQRKG